MKKIIIALALLLTAACSNTRDSYVKELDIDSNNSYNIEDVSSNKRKLEDIIVFNQEGVTIRREGNNLVLSMPELILFDFDKYDIKNGVKPSLNTLAKALKENSDIRIKIDGYTDFIGSDSYNLDLSLKRSKEIKDYLVRRGVISNNISIEGYGKQNPISDNLTEKGRARNRRVEFIISRG